MYPQGASPYDVLDLSGNVWEWCLNEYEHPDRIQEAGDASRVLRGGSWLDHLVDAAAPVRSRNLLDPRLDYYGFRVVVCSVPVG
ncbi:MAG: SUMF1/EgtB/PvdO family nonheme iron enzyme [Caldilineaceae bacterium]|nr:SUMF1/EgtB/PvdO family nonheme iron enzyme [Caldilineaceae bacterium]